MQPRSLTLFSAKVVHVNVPTPGSSVEASGSLQRDICVTYQNFTKRERVLCVE